MICANEDCNNEFEKKTVNQIFCCNECCRVQTNRKVMRDYHEKKAIRAGKKRQCSSCSANLSRYNMSSICSPCESRAKKQEIDRYMAEISKNYID